MNALEKIKHLNRNEVVYFSRPLAFEFGELPAYQKAYVSKTTTEWMKELISSGA